MAQTLLVTGGAGYIGSHVANLFANRGYDVVVVDNLIYNQKPPKINCKFYKEDICCKKSISKIFESEKIDAVAHLAALIEVGESISKPQIFYKTNLAGTINLLDCMLEHNVNKIIFSSTCAIYGEPESVPMDENHAKNPASPYAKSKLSIEYILEDYARAYGLKHVILRYFNVAGASPEIGLGENHIPETHLIPRLIRAIKNGDVCQIFGSDYATPDGTCVRDYLHVKDVAKAHIPALKYLNDNGAPTALNLGTGNGFSVREIIFALEQLMNLKAKISIQPRRCGDTPILVCDGKKSKQVLGWEPTNSSLKNILQSAVEWEKQKALNL